MEPPSYDEANLHPLASPTQVFSLPPPPSYDASLTSPPTPPPTYGEAVTTLPDPFPLLTPPTLHDAVTSPSQNTGDIIHPLTQVGAQPAASTAVVTQPPPVCISVELLTENPGLVCCPHCHRVVTSKVRYQPGNFAWCLCVLLVFTGCFCGVCLIPLFVRSLQDAHHSCPQCGNELHVFMR